MKYVTITINGITQSVPEVDLPLYIRAGYKIVEPEQPAEAPIEPEPKSKGKQK